MRRTICIAMTVIICFMMLVPMSVCAATYQLSETDMSIQIDDSMWYVFTRDNIKDNSELDELGISYDYMYDILYNNEAYMDAVLFYDDGNYIELFIRKRTLDSGIVNLSNYKESEVLKFAKELAEIQGTDTYSVHENNYKFSKTEYVDSTYGYYLCEYITIVNKDNYTFTFQSTAPFNDSEYDEIENIIDSIQFDVDISLKEPRSSLNWGKIISKGISGAVIGAGIGLVISITNKKKKKSQEESQS